MPDLVMRVPVLAKCNTVHGARSDDGLTTDPCPGMGGCVGLLLLFDFYTPYLRCWTLANAC